MSVEKVPDLKKLLPYQAIPIGTAFLEANATENKTGSWRTFRPVLDKTKCIKCWNCWIFCPDGVIEEAPDGTFDINYEYCKGCGICSNECPVGAIRMVREKEI